MADRTVLDYVQTILTEIGGDQVNSISDTIEAADVASILRQVYYELVDEMSFPYTEKLLALTGLGNVNKPTHMGIPQEVAAVNWIKYDRRTEIAGNNAYTDMIELPTREFVSFVNSRPKSDADTYQVVYENANIPLVIDKTSPPQFWTSFDDKYIVFDAYDQDVDATLQSSKSICSVEARPVLILEDTQVPFLPDNLQNLLYTQTLSRCMLALKESVNPKIERQESRLRVRSQRNKHRASRKTYNDSINYGR